MGHRKPAPPPLPWRDAALVLRLTGVPAGQLPTGSALRTPSALGHQTPAALAEQSTARDDRLSPRPVLAGRRVRIPKPSGRFSPADPRCPRGETRSPFPRMSAIRQSRGAAPPGRRGCGPIQAEARPPHLTRCACRVSPASRLTRRRAGSARRRSPPAIRPSGQGRSSRPTWPWRPRRGWRNRGGPSSPGSRFRWR